MKNIFISFFVLLSFSLFSQQRTGISYQALILNPNGEQLPGYNNQNAPLVNTDICIEFLIIDENSSTEYSETQSVKTDKYGMVNLSIGNGSFAGGYSGGWSGIVWSEKSKKLKVNLDTTGSCSSFTEISNQDLTAVPFALFAPGQEGLDGDSAYEVWLSEGNAGSVQDYLDSLKGEKGDDGLSAYQIWIDAGNTGSEAEFIDFLKGEKGDDGKSAYQTWLDAGNTGTEAEFIDFLKGEDGADGKSAYQTWIDAGNTGTEAEFISSLSGDSALQSLIKTTVEASGDNCTNGGIKIETGLDSDGDGVLGVDEVEASQTKYLCNGDDGVDGSDGAVGANQFFSSFSEIASEENYAQSPFDSYSNVITASGSWWTGVNGDIFENSYGKTYFNANLPDLITYELDNPSSEMLLDFNSTSMSINNTHACYKLKASIEFFDSNDSPIKVYSETKKGIYTHNSSISDTRYLPIITSFETSEKHIAELGQSAINLYHYQIKFITEKTPSKVILKFYSDPSSITYGSNTCTEDIYINGISTGLDGKWLNIRFANGSWWGPIGFKFSKWE